MLEAEGGNSKCKDLFRVNDKDTRTTSKDPVWVALLSALSRYFQIVFFDNSHGKSIFLPRIAIIAKIVVHFFNIYTSFLPENKT